MSSCTYRFMPSAMAQPSGRRKYQLAIRQQPQQAKMCLINERDRRPIEPPPIIQVHWLECSSDDTTLQCPYYFMVANLVSAEGNELLSTDDYLAGTSVSSMHRLRDVDDTDGGFFVFGDLFCKRQGQYRLQFSLFEIVGGELHTRQVMFSNTFRTFIPKHYPGPIEATFLSRSFNDQGVKMRIRKEHRAHAAKKKRKVDIQTMMDHLPKSLRATSPKPSSTELTTFHSSTDSVKIAPFSYPRNPYLNSHRQDLTSPPSHTTCSTKSYLHSRNTSSNPAHFSSTPLTPTSKCALTRHPLDDFPYSHLDDFSLHHSASPPSCSSSTSSNSSTSSLSTQSSATLQAPALYPLSWGNALPPLKQIMADRMPTPSPHSLVLPCPFQSMV
ncbi:hypothetical protein DM01DRAFT_1384258 [Hesseltinella vesiculosa]|uniref:Velvet domain-containing protein n=1 Tax=Hesseltinella vesiculosa TaxID=101127 RepID=A0A1X2GEP9_9FUNG|nr:hypothetical protein DM01DRAFT_1384258 [Hesseltinella vesiculosa]